MSEKTVQTEEKESNGQVGEDINPPVERKLLYTVQMLTKTNQMKRFKIHAKNVQEIQEKFADDTLIFAGAVIK